MSEFSAQRKDLMEQRKQLLELTKICESAEEKREIALGLKQIIREIALLDGVPPPAVAETKVKNVDQPKEKKADQDNTRTIHASLGIANEKRKSYKKDQGLERFERYIIGILKDSDDPLKSRKITDLLINKGLLKQDKYSYSKVRRILRDMEAAGEGDVLCIGGGFWVYAVPISADERANILKTRGGHPYRDDSLHSASTRLGLEQRKQEGKQLGRGHAFNEAQWEAARRAVQAGMGVTDLRRKVLIDPETKKPLMSESAIRNFLPRLRNNEGYPEEWKGHRTQNDIIPPDMDTVISIFDGTYQKADAGKT